MKKLTDLPHGPGVYIMRNRTKEIIYIGKARDLSKRLPNYFRHTSLSSKLNILLSTVKHIDYILTSSEREALILENKLIKKYQPRYNVIWRDDKSYPRLKLTLSEPFPRLYLTRKIKDDGSRYYGPYVHVKEVKSLLRWIKDKFPLRSCKYDLTPEKISEGKFKQCLYYHIGQCAGPCIGKISMKDYRKIVEKVRLFLEGRYKELRDVWEREMWEASRRLEFEKCIRLRDGINYLDHMFEEITVNEISEKELEERIEISRALAELKRVLNLPKFPTRIEAFDVSNIFGNEATGSMVSFFQGLPDKQNYRRFNIKSVDEINDYAMIKEIIKRRYTRVLNEHKQLPDLVLIDGGKGHLSVAEETLRELKISLPIISIAKKEEKIYLPNEKASIKLPENSPALHLLQRIRNESHRFAISFHRLKRRKKMLR